MFYYPAGLPSKPLAYLAVILVLILAVLLVYAVMASQYESLRDPFIIRSPDGVSIDKGESVKFVINPNGLVKA